MKIQKSATMVRFDDDIDKLIRTISKHKNKSISDVVRDLVIEGLSHDDDVGINEDGLFFFDRK